MIVVHRFADPRDIFFNDATRVSTDEHNNLEVWGGNDGEALLYLCAESHWHSVDIGEGEQ